ncbi:hypothetical protein ACHWQZ_G007082 [Mnemiopsis leidyi]
MDTENLENFANKVADFLKRNGKFDEFRKKCASEIEQHVSFVKAKKEVDELVRVRVVQNRKAQCPLTKNQLRQEIRALLSKRKDLLAAADSSIQFSLRNNKELFASEINEVIAQFEEEEKAEAEAKKLEQAEKASQENQEAEIAPVADAADVDIPPPPPPPPPPAPVLATARTAAAIPSISGTDTALLIQESVFHNDNMLSVPSQTSASTMNITDLLANVQSSDFAARQASPHPAEHENESTNYPAYNLEPEPAREPSPSPKMPAPPADTIVIMSKQDVAKEIYNFEKEEKQFSHYIKEGEEYEKSKYPDDIRDYKYGEHSRYDYPDYKRSSSSYKSRKHDDYRERSSSSKHRERSLSPSKYSSDRYKEYSVRDYGHSMDRMFKSPEYYLSISRSSSSRSSSKESSRDRRKREEEWYKKYGYVSKYGHSAYGSSHKYSESSRRDDYYKDYYEKRRHDDPYYKSSDRSKSRDYASYEASKSRDSSHDPYKMRDAAYEISKIRQSSSSESAKFKEPPYISSKYHEHELMKSRERDILYRERMKEEIYTSSIEVRERRTHLERPYESVGRYSPVEMKLKPPKIQSPVRSPLENHPPLTPEKSHSPKRIPTPPSFPEPEEQPGSSSRNDLDDLLERAISNIPKTPEEPSPESSLKDEGASKELVVPTVSENDIDHPPATSPVKLPSPTKSLPKSPIKPVIGEIDEDMTEFEMQVRESKVNESSRRALIDSILPKPKYCSILKETFAVDKTSEDSNQDKGNDVPEGRADLEEAKESVIAPKTDTDITKEPIRPVYLDQEPTTPEPPPEVLQKESKPAESETPESRATNLEPIITHNNQDFPIPTSPPLPPPPPTPPSMHVMSHLRPTPQPKPKPSPTPPMTSSQLTTKRHGPFSPPIVEEPAKTPTTPDAPKDVMSHPLKPPTTPPQSSSPPPPPPPPSNITTSVTANKPPEDVKKASPSKPIVLSTTRKKEKISKPSDTSDAEEGEILSDGDDSVIPEQPRSVSLEEKVESQSKESTVVDDEPSQDDEKINKENEVSEVQESDDQSLPENKELTPQPPEPKVFVPDENFPIRSKRDLFKARFFQPDMKIDFAKPDQVTDGNPKPDSSAGPEKEESDKTTSASVVEVKPAHEDSMRYSRKMRFKEVLQQHISEQENAKEQQLKESQQKETPKDATKDVSEVGGGSQHPAPAVEPGVPTVSLIGKRKRFLNDYIASLESNPPPAKSVKTDETSVEESLPKLRIKPLIGGSYSSETLTSTSSAPPPLHKAATSPEKETVPKCVIKLGKGHWNACETEKAETTGKRKGRAANRPNLRSREASTDSSKSEISEKPRTTRSKKTRKTVKSYNVEEDEKNSDNSFEEVDNSRRSGRTRKTIKRLNL